MIQRSALAWLTAGLLFPLLVLGGVAAAAPEDLSPSRSAATATVSSGPGPGVEDVEAYAREHLRDTFAGLYLEAAQGAEASGSTVVVAFTERPPAEDQAAMRRLLGGDNLRFRVVRHSLAELEQLQDRITQAMGELEDEGVTVAWVGADVRRNRVTVAVTGSLARAEAVLGQRFDLSMLDVIQGDRPVLMESNAGLAAPSEVGRSALARTSGAMQAEDAGAVRGLWHRFWTLLSAWWRALLG